MCQRSRSGMPPLKCYTRGVTLFPKTRHPFFEDTPIYLNLIVNFKLEYSVQIYV